MFDPNIAGCIARAYKYMPGYITLGLLPRPGSGKECQKRRQVLQRGRPLLIKIADLKARGEEPGVIDPPVHWATGSAAATGAAGSGGARRRRRSS